MNATAVWIGAWAASWLILSGMAGAPATADLAATLAAAMAISATFIVGPAAFSKVNALLGAKSAQSNPTTAILT